MNSRSSTWIVKVARIIRTELWLGRYQHSVWVKPHPFDRALGLGLWVEQRFQRCIWAAS